MPDSRFKSLRNAFFSGLLLVAPLVATVWAVLIVISLAGGSIRPLFSPYLPAALGHLPNIVWDVITTVVVLGLITLLGYVSHLFLGQFVGALGERLIQGIPGIGGFYHSVKQFIDTFGAKDRMQFSKVVLARKLHEHDLAELHAVLRPEGVDELLHAVVEAADAGDALDQALPQGADELPEEKMRDITQQGDQAEDDHRGDDIPDDVRQMAQGRRQVGGEQRPDGTAGQADDNQDRPDRRHQRGDQQEPAEKGIAQGFETGIGHGEGLTTDGAG